MSRRTAPDRRDATSTAVKIRRRSPLAIAARARSQTFTVDPNFLSYTTETITITAVLRRVKPRRRTPGSISSMNRPPAGRARIAGTRFRRTRAGTRRRGRSPTLSSWASGASTSRFDSDGTQFSKYQLRSVTVSRTCEAAGLTVEQVIEKRRVFRTTVGLRPTLGVKRSKQHAP